MNILKITNVEKSFGDKKIIDRISFSVPENCIYGFIGDTIRTTIHIRRI